MKRLLFVLAAVGPGPAASAADPTDPATLFPPGVVLYAEVGNPAETAAALSAYVKGTVLADALSASHDRRDKLTQPQQLPGFMHAQLLGLLTAPEALAELKRVRGAAVAVTGTDARTGRPHWAAAVLLGDSHALALQCRAYLTLAPNVRRVGKVEGVPIYQNRGLTAGRFDEQGRPQAADDPVPAEGATEPTYLYTPGLFVVGSGKAAVADVLERFTGRDASPSFAANAHLAKAVGRREGAGLFVFADTAGVLGKTETLRNLLPPTLVTDYFPPVRFLLNPKAIPAVTGRLVIEPGGLGLVLSGERVPGVESPLHDIASGSALDPTAIRHPSDAPAAFALSFPSKAKRAAAAVAAAEAMAAAAGRVGASPADRVAEAKAKGFKLDDYLSRVTAVTVFRPAKLDRPKGVPQWPLVSLRFESAADAEYGEAEFPKLAGLLAGAEKVPDLSRETVNAVRVSAVVVTGDGHKVPVHYARQADWLVFGVDQKSVAAVTKAGGKPPASPVAAKEFAASGFGYVRPSALVPEAIDWPVRPQRNPAGGPTAELNALVQGLGQLIDDLQSPQPPAANPAPLRDAVRGLAPVTVAVGTKGNTLRVEVWHRDSKKLLSAAFEQGILWLERWSGANAGPSPPGGISPYSQVERDDRIIIDR